MMMKMTMMAISVNMISGETMITRQALQKREKKTRKRKIRMAEVRRRDRRDRDPDPSRERSDVIGGGLAREVRPAARPREVEAGAEAEAAVGAEAAAVVDRADLAAGRGPGNPPSSLFIELEHRRSSDNSNVLNF